ncbi:MAG: carbohydrate kinase family protein [Patescibacteria group bacterium]|jgi:ribokinase
MKEKFVTIGGATRDISFFTDQGVLIKNSRDLTRQELLAFEYGAKIRVDEFHYSYGGGAANAAVCLAGLGLKTACLTTVGGDENGRAIIDNLRQRKVATDLIKVREDEASSLSFILIAPAGERIIFGDRGVSHKLDIDRAQLAILRRSPNIYLASLAGNWERELKKIFSIVSRKGPKIYWNPGSAQLAGGLKKLAPFLKKTEVFALNKDEAIELVLSSPEYRALDPIFLNRTDNLLKAIHSFGPKIVVITLGAKGVRAYDGQKIYYHAVLKEKKRVDTTGVGDVFNSSFAAGLIRYDGDIDKALLLGLRNTASKVAHLGAQNGLIKLK